MSRNLILFASGAILLVGLVAYGLIAYRPPHASYVDVTPAPVGQPTAGPPTAAHAQARAAAQAPTSAPALPSADTVEVGDRELLVATSFFPEQIHVVPGTPMIVSFLAQTPDLQAACTVGGATLDAGQCAIRGLSVGTLNSAKVRIPLTMAQAQMLLTARDAHAALTVAPDNAVVMATTTTLQQTPGAALTQDAAQATTSAAARATPAEASPTSGAPTSNSSPPVTTNASHMPATIAGLPFGPVAGGLVALLALGGGVFVLRRRRPSVPALAPLGQDGPPRSSLPDLNPVQEVSVDLAARPAMPATVPGLGLELRGLEAPLLLDGDGADRAAQPSGGDLFAPPFNSAVSTAAPIEDVFAVPGVAGIGREATDPSDEHAAPAPEARGPRLGPALPPAAPPAALPPPAALDRQTALRYAKKSD